MDFQERKLFWNTLCSLSGKDLKQDFDELKATIKYPKYLYRYRSVTLNNLEALRTNRLYFSSANYYDDPFDTFLNIDVEAIRKEILDALQTSEKTIAIAERMRILFNEKLTDEQSEWLSADNIRKMVSGGLLEDFLDFVLGLRDELKKDTWSVCFSENGVNETLWLKYAEQHKGFALIYDLDNDENFLCGKHEKCKNCGIMNYGTPLYPIYYSDTPHDATNYAKIVMLNIMGASTGVVNPQQLYEANGVAWERERISLIKKECHKYDEEWRMITGCQMKPPIMMEWIPSGIILGLRMEISSENLVVSMAKEAGIKNIYKSYINTDNKLDAKPVCLRND
ncbi:MAG: DUF2971 domain-containing protein [Ruminococcaceae bacterium]|nr:DUF2971 domain-containing protein [Oscillospiraceae bacterium]